MNYLITNGIKVSAETFYQPELSDPFEGVFVFSFHIKIENLSLSPVKLLHRHWFVFDSNGDYLESEGTGVLGTQPIIEIGDDYQFESGYTLCTDMGTFRGEYLFEDLETGSLYKVNVPKVDMIVPFKYN
jgi:ApaG protein